MKIVNYLQLRMAGFRMIILIVMAYGGTISCTNDIETINALTNEVVLPDVSGFNLEITYTDSGRLKGKIVTPEANDYSSKSEPYTEFPKGIKVIFYNSAGYPESYIQANYAILHKNEQLWEARGQVIAENQAKGDKLETEQIFWDQKTKRIYTQKYSTITNKDGVFYGENGFEALEDLSRWWMRGYKGKVNVPDNPPEQTANP